MSANFNNNIKGNEMEFLAVVGAVLISWWVLIPLACVVLWNTHNESEGWALFWMLILAGLLYFAFSIPLVYIGIGVAAYIPLGLVWSLYRWKRHCKYKFEQYQGKNGNYSESTSSAIEYNKNILKKNLSPKENMESILIWVFIWPFSLIDNIIGDLIDAVEKFIKRYLIRIYETIAGKYLDQI